MDPAVANLSLAIFTLARALEDRSFDKAAARSARKLFYARYSLFQGLKGV